MNIHKATALCKKLGRLRKGVVWAPWQATCKRVFLSGQQGWVHGALWAQIWAHRSGRMVGWRAAGAQLTQRPGASGLGGWGVKEL